MLSDNPTPLDAGPDTLYGLQDQQNQIVTTAGSLDEEDIELLVEAMAAYTPPEGYDAQWTPEMEAALTPEIEIAWDLLV